jgi:hypothetical protein
VSVLNRQGLEALTWECYKALKPKTGLLLFEIDA